MRKVIRIDEQGLFLEDVILQDNESIPEDCVDIEVPEGLYLPRFENGQWVEGLTPEEIEDIVNRPTPLTELDVVGQTLVGKELQAMQLALQLQSDTAFLGPRLVEIELRLQALEGSGN